MNFTENGPVLTRLMNAQSNEIDFFVDVNFDFGDTVDVESADNDKIV